MALWAFFAARPVQANPTFSVETSSIYVNSGMVGIMTSNPAKTLDVNGDTRVSGFVIVSTIQFSDGSTMTTASTSALNSGDMVLAATQTVSAQKTFTSFANFSQGLELGPTSGTRDTSLVSVWAKSVDGITESSGCVVVLKMSANDGSAGLIFTSTTTDFGSADQGVLGVLIDNSCVPGALCRVAVKGIVRAMAAASQGPGAFFDVYSTRCEGRALSTANRGQNGTTLSATDSGGWIWVLLSGG